MIGAPKTCTEIVSVPDGLPDPPDDPAGAPEFELLQAATAVLRNAIAAPAATALRRRRWLRLLPGRAGELLSVLLGLIVVSFSAGRAPGGPARGFAPTSSSSGSWRNYRIVRPGTGS
jgi:hypothetical protein